MAITAITNSEYLRTLETLTQLCKKIGVKQIAVTFQNPTNDPDFRAVIYERNFPSTPTSITNNIIII